MIDRIEQAFPESYRNGDILMIHGDCLEKMKDIPDKSVDMILCDLPYGTTACKWDVVIPFNKYVQIGEKVIYEQEYVFDKMKSGVSYKEALEDFLSISKDGLWDNYKRIIKDNGAIVLTASQPFTSALVMSNPDWFKYEWIWEKSHPTGFASSKYNPLKYHESVLIFCEGKTVYNPQMTKGKPNHSMGKIVNGGQIKSESQVNITAVQSQQSENKFPKSVQKFSNPRFKGMHPTQKPVPLFEYLIKTYTNEGETVLDNCAGSFTTAIACLNTKRSFIGIEKDAHYFQVGKDRINDAIKKLDTFL